MSIREKMMETCVLLDRVSSPDGRGGIVTTWTNGAEFMAAIAFSSSMETRIAEAQGVKSLYTVLTKKTVNLQYHDVFRRSADGKLFRVTSDGDDDHTPEGAGLNFRRVSAEEWEIPTEADDDGGNS